MQKIHLSGGDIQDGLAKVEEFTSTIIRKGRRSSEVQAALADINMATCVCRERWSELGCFGTTARMTTRWHITFTGEKRETFVVGVMSYLQDDRSFIRPLKKPGVAAALCVPPNVAANNHRDGGRHDEVKARAVRNMGDDASSAAAAGAIARLCKRRAK